ncbi:MAG: hypothetical protein NTY53_25185 [Kiritimatiellaeota bacterium]|nr:hypothetical protein [Kiritimatiellota bacterium]
MQTRRGFVARWLLVMVLLGGALPALSESVTFVAPEVTVQGIRPSQELIGPYNLPRWTARGRFTSNTEIYVLPPYSFNIDLDYTGTVPKHGETRNLFKQEFELGLPHRIQLAYENNFVLQKEHSQVTRQTIEARYALADWGKLPLNPTLFGEYLFGVGKDYAEDDAPERIPDAIELRLLLGEQFGRNCQWALNIFHEFEMGGEREWETGFSQSLSYAIHDEYLKVGLEMQFIRRTEADARGEPEYEFDIGPSLTWKPSALTRLDVATLFGTTSDSPAVGIYLVFSIAFDKDDDKGEGLAPVSTQHR